MLYLPIVKYSLMIGVAIPATIFPLMYSVSSTVTPGGGIYQSSKEAQNLNFINREITASNEDTTNLKLSKSENFQNVERLPITATSSREGEIYKNIEIAKDVKNLVIDNLVSHESYHKFLKHFWEIIRRTLWVDGVNSIPWIYAVRGTLPTGRSTHLYHYLVKKELKEGLSEYSVAFNKESVKKIKDWGVKWSSTVTTPIRKGMEELFLRFISLNWELNTSIFKSKELKNKLSALQISHYSSVEEDYPTQIIRFTRKSGNQEYYLEIVFNSKPEANQLYIPLIEINQKYYQANGEAGVTKKYIGAAKTSENVIDKSFSNMFEKLNTEPSNFYKQLTIVGECLEDFSNCGALFAMKDNHISKENPSDKALNRIHPFADIYWRVQESYDSSSLLPKIWQAILLKELN